MKHASAIICAYNEAPRIDAVLDAVVDHPHVGEVIVIDDGSDDGTADIAERPGVRVIRHEKNRGKSAAVASGVEAASYPLLLFLDADLKGITPRDIDSLLMPVISGTSDVAISMRKSSYLACHLVGVDFLSGERVIPKRLLEKHIREMRKLTPFGIEVYENQLIIKEQLKIASVDLENVVGLHKSEKMGIVKGLYEDLKMFDDILKIMPLEQMLYQNYAMSLLSSRKSMGQLFEMKKLLSSPVATLTKPFKHRKKHTL